MKTILMMMVMLVGCGDDASTNGGPDGSVDGSVDGDGSVTPPPDGRTDDSLSPQPMIPGGTFLRSFDNVTFTNNSYPATISSFTLDEYEVTVARFRVFVASTALPTAALGCSVVSFPQHGTWTDAVGANESLPINCITWTEANAFCAWDGGRLPTEAEWNYAAAGGSEQREYPWGSAPYDDAHANTGNALAVVGSRPMGDGRWGHADLSGNVAEWTLDWYADPYVNPCVDCANTTPGVARVYRGGGVGTMGTVPLTASSRRSAAPTNRSPAIGVRCAR